MTEHMLLGDGKNGPINNRGLTSLAIEWFSFGMNKLIQFTILAWTLVWWATLEVIQFK